MLLKESMQLGQSLVAVADLWQEQLSQATDLIVIGLHGSRVGCRRRSLQVSVSSGDEACLAIAVTPAESLKFASSQGHGFLGSRIGHEEVKGNLSRQGAKEFKGLGIDAEQHSAELAALAVDGAAEGLG
jgi:hypothetical protein